MKFGIRYSLPDIRCSMAVGGGVPSAHLLLGLKSIKPVRFAHLSFCFQAFASKLATPFSKKPR